MGLLAEGISPRQTNLEDASGSVVVAVFRVVRSPNRAGRGPESGGVIGTEPTICGAAWAEPG